MKDEAVRAQNMHYGLEGQAIKAAEGPGDHFVAYERYWDGRRGGTHGSPPMNTRRGLVNHGYSESSRQFGIVLVSACATAPYEIR